MGKEGEADLKKHIVARSQEANMQMVHSGAHDDVRFKVMSNAQAELTAYVCIHYIIMDDATLTPTV